FLSADWRPTRRHARRTGTTLSALRRSATQQVGRSALFPAAVRNCRFIGGKGLHLDRPASHPACRADSAFLSADWHPRHARRTGTTCPPYESPRGTETGSPASAGLPVSTGRAYLPYTGNLAQMALTFSRTASITASLFRSARMSQIQPASSRHSASLKPRVVTAGVPMRRPEVTNGERGSFGTLFLFTVM